MKISVIEKEKNKNIYGELYGERKRKGEEDFFFGIFALNKESTAWFIGIVLFSLAMLGSYFLLKAHVYKLTMLQLALFMFLGILDLLFITRFAAYYIAIPRLSRRVEEKLTSNWADAIRYSRYPATMIISVFTIFVWMTWIIVSTELRVYLTRLHVIFMFAPLICSMIGYSASAIYSFRGTSPAFAMGQKKNASIKSSAYWMVAEAFLIFSLVDVFILTVYLLNYVIL